MEKEAMALHLEATALCLEAVALYLKIRANRIKEEEAMADLLAVCQEEEAAAAVLQVKVVAGDRIHSQCHHSDCQRLLQMVV
jgi:hypothetical protein